MVLKYSHVRAAAFLYMGLPFLIFSLTWLAFLPALISATVTIFILVLVVKPDLLKKNPVPEGASLNPNATEHIHVPTGVMLTVIVATGLWIWWSGIGGGFYQSGDFPYRNAVFRDLIQYDWPVIYGGEKGMLAYYIGFWLPAAVCGKFVALFTENAAVIWQMGNTALYLWALLGVLLVLVWNHRLPFEK